MATETRSLIQTIEGPKGKAEVYELLETSEDRQQQMQYEVICGDRRERVRALGHASILADEMTGRA